MFCHLSKFISTVVPVEAPAAEVVITVSKGSAAADRMTVGAVVLTLPPEAASWPPLHVVEATTTEAAAGPPRSFMSIVELYCVSIVPVAVVDGCCWMLLSRSAVASGWAPGGC